MTNEDADTVVPALYRAAYSVLRDDGLAMDCVNQAFMTYLQKRESVDSLLEARKIPLAAWLTRVSMFHARNRLRVRQNEQRFLRRHFKRQSLKRRQRQPIKVRTESPEIKNLYSEFTSILSEDEKELVKLLIVDGRTYQEVGLQFGIAASTAWTCFQRCLKKMRPNVEKLGGRDLLASIGPSHTYRDDAVAKDAIEDEDEWRGTDWEGEGAEEP